MDPEHELHRSRKERFVIVNNLLFSNIINSYMYYFNVVVCALFPAYYGNLIVVKEVSPIFSLKNARSIVKFFSPCV